MSDFYWLNDAQMARLALYFPKSRGKLRVHCRAVIEIMVGRLKD